MQRPATVPLHAYMKYVYLDNKSNSTERTERVCNTYGGRHSPFFRFVFVVCRPCVCVCVLCWSGTATAYTHTWYSIYRPALFSRGLRRRCAAATAAENWPRHGTVLCTTTATANYIKHDFIGSANIREVYN